jgi:hypothetical protein
VLGSIEDEGEWADADDLPFLVSTPVTALSRPRLTNMIRLRNPLGSPSEFHRPAGHHPSIPHTDSMTVHPRPPVFMTIQDEPSGPADPLQDLSADYHHGILHLAFERDRKTGQGTLLFAFVEMIPAEIPPPIDDFDPKASHCSCPLPGGKYHLYVRHLPVPARIALDWYLACRDGVAVLPEVDGSLPERNAAGAKLLGLARLGEEPPWPTLNSAGEDREALPFCPDWLEYPRTHHLFPLAAVESVKRWTEKERIAATAWLATMLYFNFDDYPEYWGSIHLVAANPVYRDLSCHRQKGSGAAESAVFRFLPRADHVVDGLELHLHEEEPWGTTALPHVRIKATIVRINFSREMNSVRTDVVDSRRGILSSAHQSYPFRRSFSIGIADAHTLIVRRGQESFTVDRVGAPETVSIGADYRPAPSRLRMLDAHYARRTRRLAASLGQRWFQGQREEARTVLRCLLNEASTRVLFIDPYFAAEEMADFALAVGRVDLPIQILSSAMHLRKSFEKNDVEHGDRLLKMVEQLRSMNTMNPFEIRVLPGKASQIHDRFLLVDQRIWLLGSSLNEFGSRGTMMVALPDPGSVEGELLRAWDNAEPLSQWVTARKQAKPATETP